MCLKNKTRSNHRAGTRIRSLNDLESGDDLLLQKIAKQCRLHRLGKKRVYTSLIYVFDGCNISPKDFLIINTAANRAKGNGTLESYGYRIFPYGVLCYNNVRNRYKIINASANLYALIKNYS